MTIKAVIWDIDGVLIWNHPDPHKDWRQKLIEKDVLLAWEGFQKSELWEACLRDEHKNTRDAFTDFLRSENITLYVDSNAVIDSWLRYNVIPCEPSIQKLLAFAERGYECVLATNQDGLRKPYVERFLKEHGLENLKRFVSCEIGVAKPDAAFFETVQHALKLAPEELILLDDTYKNIEGAQKSGWRVQHIDDRFREIPSQWIHYDF